MIPMMEFYLPASTEMYYSEVRKTIDFEMLDPDAIIQIFMPDQTLMTLLFGDSFADTDPDNVSETSQSFQAAGVDSLSFASNMRIYIIGLIMFTLLLMILSCLAILPCLRARIFNALRSIVSSTIFNGVIGSVSISYLALCMTSVMQIRTYIDATTEERIKLRSTLIEGSCMYLLLLAYPLFLILWIGRQGDEITTPYAAHRYGVMFDQINIMRSTWAKYFHPIFLLRRWVCLSLPLWFCFTPSLNFIFMLLFQTFYAILYGVGMNLPHMTNRLRTIELMNEWLF
jgi:hypothetical protein